MPRQISAEKVKNRSNYMRFSIEVSAFPRFIESLHIGFEDYRSLFRPFKTLCSDYLQSSLQTIENDILKFQDSQDKINADNDQQILGLAKVASQLNSVDEIINLKYDNLKRNFETAVKDFESRLDEIDDSLEKNLEVEQVGEALVSTA